MGCILRHTRRLSQGRAGCAVGLASHGWHGNGRARHGGVLDLPLRGHGLDLSVELDALVGERRLLVSTTRVQRVFLIFDAVMFRVLVVVVVVYLLAVEVGVSSEGASGAGEGEHGQGDGDGHVHADLYKCRQYIRGHNMSLYTTIEHDYWKFNK